jgi:Mrp family chromosome partitioning ATPase
MITRKLERLTAPLLHDCQAMCRDVTDQIRSSALGVTVPGNEIAADVTDRDVRDYYLTLLRGLARTGTALHDDPLQTLAITSCQRGEGVSTVAAQLAVTAALSDARRVLLVDANIAYPALHKMLGVTPNADQSDQTRRQPSVQPTRHKNLGLLSAVSFSGNDATNLFCSTERFAHLVLASKRYFDLVICDMPATNQANSPLDLFQFFDGVLLVAEAERVRWEVAVRTRQRLAQAGANLLGVVLNKRTHHVPNWLYRTL